MIFIFKISKKHFFELFREGTSLNRGSMSSIVSQEIQVSSGICFKAMTNMVNVFSPWRFFQASLGEGIVQWPGHSKCSVGESHDQCGTFVLHSHG